MLSAFCIRGLHRIGILSATPHKFLKDGSTVFNGKNHFQHKVHEGTKEKRSCNQPLSP